MAGRLRTPGRPLDAREALTRLTVREPVQGRFFELRHLAGLTLEQAAKAVGLSTMTAHRPWSSARVSLRRVIVSDTPSGLTDTASQKESPAPCGKAVGISHRKVEAAASRAEDPRSSGSRGD
jgi:hypothetical protein